jgi:hypothetical protein
MRELAALRSFLADDLGFRRGAAPGRGTVRSGVLIRRFWGSWQLEGPYREKFRLWMKSLFAIPLVYAHGLDTRDISFLFTDLKLKYDRKCLGDFIVLRSASSASRQLADDCEQLDDMARAYAARFQARLDWEAAHPRTGAGARDDGNPTPMTLLDVIGEDAVRAIIEERKRRRGMR